MPGVGDADAVRSRRFPPRLCQTPCQYVNYCLRRLSCRDKNQRDGTASTSRTNREARPHRPRPARYCRHERCRRFPPRLCQTPCQYVNYCLRRRTGFCMISFATRSCGQMCPRERAGRFFFGASRGILSLSEGGSKSRGQMCPRERSKHVHSERNRGRVVLSDREAFRTKNEK